MRLGSGKRPNPTAPLPFIYTYSIITTRGFDFSFYRDELYCSHSHLSMSLPMQRAPKSGPWRSSCTSCPEFSTTDAKAGLATDIATEKIRVVPPPINPRRKRSSGPGHSLHEGRWQRRKVKGLRIALPVVYRHSPSQRGMSYIFLLGVGL